MCPKDLLSAVTCAGLQLPLPSRVLSSCLAAVARSRPADRVRVGKYLLHEWEKNGSAVSPLTALWHKGHHEWVFGGVFELL